MNKLIRRMIFLLIQLEIKVFHFIKDIANYIYQAEIYNSPLIIHN